jgi:hypothetical protein
MEIMTEARKLVPGDLCDTDGDIARVLHGAGARAIPAFAEILCVEFPDKDRVRVVFASLGAVTMPSQYLVPVVYVQQPVAPLPEALSDSPKFALKPNPRALALYGMLDLHNSCPRPKRDAISEVDSGGEFNPAGVLERAEVHHTHPRQSHRFTPVDQDRSSTPRSLGRI